MEGRLGLAKPERSPGEGGREGVARGRRHRRKFTLSGERRPLLPGTVMDKETKREERERRID